MSQQITKENITSEIAQKAVEDRDNSIIEAMNEDIKADNPKKVPLLLELLRDLVQARDIIRTETEGKKQRKSSKSALDIMRKHYIQQNKRQSDATFLTKIVANEHKKVLVKHYQLLIPIVNAMYHSIRSKQLAFQKLNKAVGSTADKTRLFVTRYESILSQKKNIDSAETKSRDKINVTEKRIIQILSITRAMDSVQDALICLELSIGQRQIAFLKQQTKYIRMDPPEILEGNHEVILQVGKHKSTKFKDNFDPTFKTIKTSLITVPEIKKGLDIIKKAEKEYIGARDGRTFAHWSRQVNEWTNKRLTELMGFKITSHRLREIASHIMAHLFMKENDDINAFRRDILGHADLNSLQNYSKLRIVKDKDKRENADKIDIIEAKLTERDDQQQVQIDQLVDLKQNRPVAPAAPAAPAPALHDTDVKFTHNGLEVYLPRNPRKRDKKTGERALNAAKKYEQTLGIEVTKQILMSLGYGDKSARFAMIHK